MERWRHMSGKVLFIHEYSIYLMKYSILDELLLYIKKSAIEDKIYKIFNTMSK